MAQDIDLTAAVAVAGSRPTPSMPPDLDRRGGECPLWTEVLKIRKLVAECEADIRQGTARRLPGNAAFLADGRVLCRERNRGDSRYSYGADGFNLWVTSSGYISGNQGLFFLFLPAQEGEQPPIAFLAGVQLPGGHEYLPHSFLPVPFLHQAESREVDRYSVIGHDATYFVAETSEVLSVVRIFLVQARPNHPHLHISTLVHNVTHHTLGIYTSSYMNPFCRHQFTESSEDRWFKEIRVGNHPEMVCTERDARKERGLILSPFIVKTNEDISRFCSVTNFALLRRSVSARTALASHDLAVSLSDDLCPNTATNGDEGILSITAKESTSPLAYLGSPRRSLSSAEFLSTGTLSREVARTVFNENAIIGDLLRVDLPGDAYLRTDYVFSIPDNKEVLELELSRPLGPADTDQAIARIRQRLQHNGNLSMTFGEGTWNGLDSRTFNHFLPFLKKQVALCANIRGYLQRSSNSLVGFRDVFQAIDGHLFDRPFEARAKILEALGMVLVDGRCPRQYTLPANGYPGRMDLRQFIDQGVWAISTVYNYVAVTGDISILSELLGYQQLSEVDEKACEAAKERDSVLDHLLRIMCYLDQQRDSETGLILSLYGDWNDALDGLGVSDDPKQPFGTGVSVMTSLQVLQNCGEICELLARFTPGQYAEEVDRYTKRQQQLRDSLLKFAVISQDGARRILHGWGDRRRYFVGSFKDCDGLARDGLTSNAFWVLSDMLGVDNTLKPHILAALHRLDSPFGFKTFSPGFASDASGVGRINRLPMGAAENGAAYLHATTFAIAALFRMGQAEHAWQQIAKIVPFAPHHEDASHSPFVMPNSYVFNPQLNLTGQSMNDWQTGCSNVLLKLLVRYVFGFQPGLDDLTIAPADWLPFDGFVFQGTAHGKRVRITFRYADVLSRRFTLNGTELSNTTYDDGTQNIAAHLDYAALESNLINQIAVIDPRPHR